MPKSKNNWYETPTTVRMTTEELETVAREQRNYFSIMPDPYEGFEGVWIDHVIIYDDEGQIFLKARKESKNSWKVQTTF